jgi:hypothetical protein
MTIEKVLNKETHYTRGRDIPAINGMVVEVNYTSRYKKELATLAAKEYILDRYKQIYGNLSLKEDDELEKLYEIRDETKNNIIKYTSQSLTLDMISRINGMPNISQMKEIIESDRSFRLDFENAKKTSSIYNIDEKETLIKNFIDGNVKEHLDAFGVSVAGNMLGSLVKEKNPEKYAPNNKSFPNSAESERVYKPTEIKMMVEQCLLLMDKRDLQSIIKKAQDILDDLITKDLEIINP